MVTTIDGDGNDIQYNRDGSIRMANEFFDDIRSSPVPTWFDYHDALYSELLRALNATSELGLTGIKADNYVKARLLEWQSKNPQPSCLPADATAVTTSAEVDRYLNMPDPDPLTIWDKIRLRRQRFARRTAAAVRAFKEAS